MYLTRIAGIETLAMAPHGGLLMMYLTRIAGIETYNRNGRARKARDVSYPHSGN